MKEKEIKNIVDLAMQSSLQNLYLYKMGNNLPKWTEDYESIENQCNRYLQCAKYLGYAQAAADVLSQISNALMVAVPLEKMEDSTLDFLKNLQSLLVNSMPVYNNIETLRNLAYRGSPTVFSMFDFTQRDCIDKLYEEANNSHVGYYNEKIKDAYRTAFDEMKSSFERMIKDRQVSEFFPTFADRSPDQLEALKGEVRSINPEVIKDLQHRLITYYNSIKIRQITPDLRVSRKLQPDIAYNGYYSYDYSALARDLGLSIDTSGFDDYIDRVKPLQYK